MNTESNFRIAVWLDPTTPQESALQVLAGMGTAAEILGLFVEDTNLLGLSGLSVAREITSEGKAAPQLDEVAIEQQFRAHAARMRRVFEHAVRELEARRSFHVARGEPRAELLKLSADCDALVLSHSRRHFGPRLTMRMQLGELLCAGPPTLVIVQERWRTGDRVVALFDGSAAAEAALRSAAAIAAGDGLALSVWLPDVEAEAHHKLELHAASTIGDAVDYAFTTVNIEDLGALVRAAGRENARVMVLPDKGPVETPRRVAELLDRVSCSLVVVR